MGRRRPELRGRPIPIALLAALGLAALSACAGAGPQDPAPKGPRSTLFLSPAGEPFRAGPGQPYPVGAWFAQADANHDGKLTRDEFRADFSRFFKVLDENNNGSLDGVETQHYEQVVAPEVLPRLAQIQGGFPGERGSGDERRLAEPPRAKNGQSYDGAPAYSLLNVSEPVVSADADFDGKITLEEFLQAADRRFDQLDKDKDGSLTLQALPQTPEQIAVEGRRRR
jgi:Ca2+-binding EF-hand superfamily protein